MMIEICLFIWYFSHSNVTGLILYEYIWLKIIKEIESKTIKIHRLLLINLLLTKTAVPLCIIKPTLPGILIVVD